MKMITHQCLMIIFSDHQDFCFDCLEIMFKLKFQGNIYNKFSLARYINVPGFINSHLEQKKKKEENGRRMFDAIRLS